MNIVVTGANGFLGGHLMAKLRAMGHDPYPVASKTYNLRRAGDIEALFTHAGPVDVLYHLAAHVGGIAYNLKNPAKLFYDNVMMNTQLIHQAALAGVGKFVFVGSVCSYPKFPTVPTREHNLWLGYPEESNGPYGVSKLMALEQLQGYWQQYGLKFGYPVLANLYGPGDRGFFEADKAHVVPALIKRFASDGDEVEVWGDGTPSRDFLFVEDAVAALVRYLEVDSCEPINIATGVEVRIRRLVDLICEATGFKGTVLYDHTRPAGQLRRCYDIGRAREVLGWTPAVGIDEGIKRTVEWWINSRPS